MSTEEPVIVNEPEPEPAPPQDDPEPPPADDNEPHLFDFVLEKAMKAIKDREINATTMLSIIVILMQIVDSYKTKPPLPGTEKKDLVIRVLNKIIESRDLSDEDEASIKFIVSKLAPQLIDTIIDASKNKFNLNKNGGCCTIV